MSTSTTAGTPTAPAGASSPTPPGAQLANLKALVGQLQAKIERLESQAGDAIGSAKETLGLTPAQHLRIVLMGPPGAGKFIVPYAQRAPSDVLAGARK